MQLKGLVVNSSHVQAESPLEELGNQLVHLCPRQGHQSAGLGQCLVAFGVLGFQLGHSLSVEGVESVLVELCHDAEAGPFEEEVEVLVVFVLLGLVADFSSRLLDDLGHRVELQTVTVLGVLGVVEIDDGPGLEELLVESLGAHAPGLRGFRHFLRRVFGWLLDNLRARFERILGRLIDLDCYLAAGNSNPLALLTRVIAVVVED